VPGQVEGDDAKTSRHLRIVENVAPLPAVRPGGVEAEERDPFARLLDEDAQGLAAVRDAAVAAEDRLELRHGRLRRCA
jgi:hypothetical protein